ncbi:MAG: Cna B-type domain-containing protein, partial [Firmicutes bacterium]|nr:Cna B-type domain-containing protein [Bacillota bacterium]
EDQGVSVNFGDQNNRSIRLNNPNSVGVYSIKASQLNQYSNNPMKLMGFTKDGNGSMIINVDCSGVSTINLPPATIFIDGVEQSTNEVTEFSNGKVIWNFINASGATINTNRMTGMVIALGATVNINQNLNGTVIAENINVRAESHRTDFTGHIRLRDSGIAIRKVDADNIGIHLEGAEFKLVKWNGSEYVTVAEKLTTDDEGLLEIDDIDYNTAYQLIETKAPAGYQLRDTAYIFFVPHSNTTRYPVKKPSGFTGSEHKEQEIKNIRNEKADVLSITVDKEWYIDKTKVTWIDGLVTIDVYQKVYSDSDRTKEITSLSNRIYAEDIQIDSHNGWKIKLDNLPRSATETIGGAKTKVYYSYYVQEDPVRGFTTSYENNSGITSGNITVINRSEPFDEPKLTEIKIDKKWFNFEEEQVAAPEYSSITAQLYQTAYEDSYFHHQIGETISYGEPIELSDANNWTHTVTGLPEYALIETDDGPQVVYYSYTVKEKAIGGYQDTYENNGIYSGTITIKNTQKDHPTYLIVKKFWKDENGNDEVKDGTITLDVYQKIYGYIDEHSYDEDDYHGAKLYRKDVKVSSEDGWKASIEGLPLHGWMLIDGQRVRVSYTYYVQEKEVDGYKSVYENNQGIVEGTITITNRAYSSYSLPETGGMGTNHFVVFGVLLMMLSMCGYFLYNKKMKANERMDEI